MSAKLKSILAHIGAGLAAAAPVLLTPGPFDGTKVGMAVGAFLVGCGLLHATAPGAK